MNLRNIGVVYRKELREALRDRRTLISSLLVPLIIFPLLTAGLGAAISALVGKAKEEIPSVMILGGDDSPEFSRSCVGSSKIKIVPTAAELERSDHQQGNSRSRRNSTRFSERRRAARTGHSAHSQLRRRPEIVYRHRQHPEKPWRSIAIASCTTILSARNVPDSALKPFEIKEHNVAPPEKVGGAAFGGVIGYMVILLCLVGSMYPAMDLTAGEKERGTMETILSSPISRVDLVFGKFFLVLTTALVTAGAFRNFHGRFVRCARAPPRLRQGRSEDAAQMQLHIGLTTVLSIFIMVLADCRAVCCRPHDRCALRQKLQGSAELHQSADVRGDHSRRSRHASDRPGR